jgi:transcriptional regulator GlxA family with amidase domain
LPSAPCWVASICTGAFVLGAAGLLDGKTSQNPLAPHNRTLDSGRNATEAAEASGFSSYEALRRAFARHLGISPTRYQQRFRTSRTDQN